jgi:O-antigen/teichoic acid export membrane protein
MGLVATHYLLPNELGEYAVFYAAFLLAAVVPATLVFAPLEVVSLDLPRAERTSILRETIPFGALTALLSGVLVCGATLPLVAKVGLTIRVEFMLTAMALSCASPVQDHLRRMFHQAGRSWTAAWLSLIQIAIVATTIVVARAVSIPLPLVPFGALAIGNLISLPIGLRLARWRSGPPRRLGPAVTQTLRTGGWLTFGSAFGFAAGLAAIAILSDRSGPTAAGQTEAARVLSQPVTVIAVGMIAVFGPEMMIAAQRGLVSSVRKMMTVFNGIIALTTLLWLLAVGVRWSWSPVGKIFATAYDVRGLLLLMIMQQALGYAGLAYRAVLIGNGLGRNVGILDVFTGILVVAAVYIFAPHFGAFAFVWAFLGIDSLIFGVRARMAMQSVRAAGRTPALSTIEVR